MRIPIKLNWYMLPNRYRKILLSRGDPRNINKSGLTLDSFNESISSIKIDSTWKSTSRRRHCLTDQLITELAVGYPNLTVLEIGASSGSTSLDLLNRLDGDYTLYYVTDLFFDIPCQIKGKFTYFYHPLMKHCIMCVSDMYTVYDDLQNAIFPLGVVANHILARAPKYDSTKSFFASMLHPDLKQLAVDDSRIVFEQYDIFDVWENEPVDIVKVANVLNRAYFCNEKIRLAITNLKRAVKPDGCLIITDNRDIEKVSVFFHAAKGKFVLERELNGGADVSEIVKEV